MAQSRRFRVKFFDVLKRDKAISALLFLFLALPFMYNACQKSDPLVPLNSIVLQSVKVQDVQVNFCTPPSVPENMYVKELIIFDHSGSNKANYQMDPSGNGAPISPIQVLPSLATDPSGTTRYGTPTTPGTLLNYLNTLPPNNPLAPQRYFALIDFNGSITNSSSSFTSNIAGFYNTVLADAGQNVNPVTSPQDAGSTSYISALTQASALINADISNAQSCAAKPKNTPPSASCPAPGVITPSTYVIVFMSDGSPILSIIPNPNGTFTINKESTTTILSAVEGLVNLQATYSQFVAAVNLFTIYYYVPGNVDLSGQLLLQQMAQDGNGIPYDALSGSNINYSQFEPPAKLVQTALTDIFVTNASGVWWTDGLFHLDSDGDGLPDFIETAMGSNPNNPNTFNNGLSDLVNYQLKNGAPCNAFNGSGICTDPVTATGTLCTGIPKVGAAYKSSDPNGLNDCEKVILNDTGGVNNPDSNADSIPDFLEFVNGVPFQAGTTPAVTTPQQDGYSIYEKIKYSLPVQVPLNSAINLAPSNYQVNLVSQSLTQSCYNVVVTKLPQISSTDKIRVDITMKNNLPTNNYSYYRGFKKFTAGQNQLIINDWTNAAEIANKTWSIWP